MDGNKLEHDIVAEWIASSQQHLIEIAAFFIIVIPSHRPNNVLRKRGERKLRLRDGRRSDLPIREVTKARAGKLAPWRDCVGKFVPGPLRVLPLQESLGKRNTKKKWGFGKRTSWLGEEDGKWKNRGRR